MQLGATYSLVKQVLPISTVVWLTLIAIDSLTAKWDEGLPITTGISIIAIGTVNGIIASLGIKNLNIPVLSRLFWAVTTSILCSLASIIPITVFLRTGVVALGILGIVIMYFVLLSPVVSGITALTPHKAIIKSLHLIRYIGPVIILLIVGGVLLITVNSLLFSGVGGAILVILLRAFVLGVMSAILVATVALHLDPVAYIVN